MNAIFEQRPLRQINKEKEVVIGSISVLDETRNVRTIVVCQKCLTHYQGNLKYLKTFYLESPDGRQVYPTKDPAVYRLLDGTKLKRCRHNGIINRSLGSYLRKSPC